MSRPLRLELSGGLYHVPSRGDRREDIYQDEADRELWLDTHGDMIRWHGCFYGDFEVFVATDNAKA